MKHVINGTFTKIFALFSVATDDHSRKVNAAATSMVDNQSTDFYVKELDQLHFMATS